MHKKEDANPSASSFFLLMRGGGVFQMYENLLQVLLYQAVVTGVWTNHKKKINIKKFMSQT